MTVKNITQLGFQRGRGLTAPKLLERVAGKEQVSFFRGRGVEIKKKIKI